MFDAQIVTFLVAITLLTIVPGSDTMLVIRSVLTRGQLAGFLTTLGICCGLFVHATLSALGLSVIVVRSAIAYEVLKGLGACYLIGLGLWTIVQALRQPPYHAVSAEQLPRVPRIRQRW
ncbi:MAG: LysE family translocator, partial [Chloroflexales bacterium]|nr:LysE family translocator [Chloroflexales bacterium]